jgi:hypothetical protein
LEIEMIKAEERVRERLANNGRNPANNNAGIRVGSDLHLCEMLLAELDSERREREKLSRALRQKDEAMGVLFDRLAKAGVDCSDLVS